MIKDILLLGNPDLYLISDPIKKAELPGVEAIAADLHDTIMAFKAKYNCGRAIAAPQIGVRKRLLYMYIDSPVVFINPVLTFPDNQMMEVLDDCMSFPNLLVKVNRYKHCVISYKDRQWNDCNMSLEGDLSELLQHEYDHLDGILATMLAINNQCFYIKK